MKNSLKSGLILTLLTVVILTMLGCSKDNPAGRAQLIDIALTEEEYAFGVDKKQPELLAKVNELIAKIQSDGTFDEIYENYFGNGSPKMVISSELDDSKDQLVVATNAAFEPFEYMAGDKYYGIDMEVAALLAEYLGKELVICNMDFEAVCLSVGQGKADIAMAGLTINENRKEFVAFSNPYYNASQKIIVREGDKTFDDCETADQVEAILSSLTKSFKIGVQAGTTGQFFVEGDEDWEFDGFDVTCVGYNSGSLAVQDLLNGNIHYVVIDEAPAAFIVTSMNETN